MAFSQKNIELCYKYELACVAWQFFHTKSARREYENKTGQLLPLPRARSYAT